MVHQPPSGARVLDFELAGAAGGGVSATVGDFKIGGDVTGGRGFDFAAVTEF